jgi:hypothetical protein
VSAPARRGRDRDHLASGRRRRLFLRYSEGEFGEVAEAARRAGLTPTGYAAEAALAAARGGQSPRQEPWREALAELIDARTQVRRFGSNVNQAVRALNASGEPPEGLNRAVDVTARAVEAVDRAAADLVRRLA